MSNQHDPIGIFDSGIGGLTVANAIHKLLPNEGLIYFGDTAHLPYGDKSAIAIKSFAKGITDFLLDNKCKLIVIACNTASAHAYEAVKKQASGKAIVVNVIDPMANFVAKKYASKHIGIIGTKGTINSRVYVKKINKLSPAAKVSSLATPLLAPMIEEGFFNNLISKTIINSYLSKKHMEGIDALVLGCTHYPLIKKEVELYYKKKAEVIDSSELIAQVVKEQLSKKQLLNPRTTQPKNKFFVSDYTDAFEKSTRFFFENELHLKKNNIWKSETPTKKGSH